MDRYWQSGAVPSAPAVPANNAGCYPANGNPAAGINGTVPGEWWYHAVSEELRNVIVSLGGTPDYTKVNQLATVLANEFAQTTQDIMAQLAKVATSGQYADLLGTPDLSVYLEQVTAQGSNGVTVSGAGTAASPLDVSAQLDLATGNVITVSAAGLAVTAGTAAGDVVQLDGNARLPGVDGSALTGLTAAQVGADPAGTADADMAAHLAATDPHPQYLDDARGDARYDALGAAQQANAISVQSIPATLDGAADGYLLQVSGPPGAEQIVAVPSSLASTPQNQQMLYLATTTETIAGGTYYQFSTASPTGAPTQLTNAATTAATENLIGAWVSQAASSETDIPAGTWTISPWYAADNNANELHVDISTLDATTGTITPVAQTIYNPSVTALQLHAFTMAVPAMTIPAGQRLLVQFYSYAAAKGHTITLWFGGAGYGSSVEYPVALVHNALGGLQGGSGTERYHLSAAGAAAAEALVTSPPPPALATLNTTTPNSTTPVEVFPATALTSATNADVSIVPSGNGAFQLAVPDNTATGGNKRGTYAVDLQLARGSASQVAGGVYSFAAGYGNAVNGEAAFAGGYTNTVQQYAAAFGTSNSANNYGFAAGSGNSAGQYATALGQGSTASGQGSFACGFQCQASGAYSYAMGSSTSAYGQYSFAVGKNAVASPPNSIALGSNAISASAGRVAISCAPVGYATHGWSQFAHLSLSAQTINTTPLVATSDGYSPSYSNQLNVTQNTAMRVRLTAVARDVGAGGTDVKEWTGNLLLARGSGGAGTVTIIGQSIISTYATAGASSWTIAAGVDTTNGALQMTVTGTSASISWNIHLESYEAV